MQKAQYTRFKVENSPGLQRSHEARPGKVWNRPASQSSHVHVMLLAYLPLSHGVQRPSSTISPDGQCVGAGVGIVVGAADGGAVGAGETVGSAVGGLVGAGDGTVVGVGVGLGCVGASVGVGQLGLLEPPAVL